MATLREAGTAGAIYKQLIAKYFPGHELQRPFTPEELTILARTVDMARKFSRPFAIYVEAACAFERQRGEGRPPTLVNISGERYMRNLITAGVVNLWEPARKKSNSEQHQQRIHEIIGDKRYWDLQTVPVAELTQNEMFCSMFTDSGQPFGIWQAALIRYFEAHDRKASR